MIHGLELVWDPAVGHITFRYTKNPKLTNLQTFKIFNTFS